MSEFGEIGQIVKVGVWVDISTSGEFAQVVILLFVKCGHEHSSVRGGAAKLSGVGVGDGGDFRPGSVGDSVDADLAKTIRQVDAGTDFEEFIGESLFAAALAVVPVAVVFLGSVIYKVLRGALEALPCAAIDGAPVVAGAVGGLGEIDLAGSDIVEGDKLDPGAVGQPAEVEVIGVSLGAVTKILPIAE